MTKSVDKLLPKWYHDENRNTHLGEENIKMSENLELVDELETSTVVCNHHWIIDMPSGRLSQGQCKLCGDTKEFMNSIESGFWEDDTTAQVAHGGANFLNGSPSPAKWDESEEDRF